MKSIILFFSLFFSGMYISCHSHSHEHSHDEHGGEAHAHDDHEENTSFVELTKAQIASIGLETGLLEKKQLTASLKANGFLKVPNQNKANATAMLGGVVSNILVQAGNIVKKGQTLVTITNPAFITLQEEYLTLSESVTMAKIEVQRQTELQEGNANALKTLQQAETEHRKLLARQASLKKQLELLGINYAKLTPENIKSTVSIISPIQGAISEVKVNMGSYVDANMAIAEIVDHSHLHLDLYVFEKDLDKLRTGQTIHFTMTNNPGKEYDAKVFGISNTFEPETKAIAVHAAVEGDKQGLIDGMSITALVSLDHATVNALPVEAIVNHQGQDFIFIESTTTASDTAHQKEGITTYRKIPVKRGTTDIGYSEITLLENIPDGTMIVVKGAFFLMAKMTNQGEAHQH